jgi:predicted NBD/HSP70 family sugar kinase
LTVPRARAVLAVDIGGTKLAAGLVDASDGRILARRALPTPDTGDAEEVFAALVGLLDGLGPGVAGAEVCGIGSGGPMAAGGETLTPVHIPAWRDFPLRRRMAEATGLAVFVDNDAKAVALAEGWVGAAVGLDAYIGMVVSTGIGGGIVLDGRLLDGRAVASVANLLDLQLAVVAGSVALGFGAPFFSAAQAEIDALARLDFSRGTRIRPAGLGADAPLVGAAAVALHRLGRLPCCR